MRALPRTTEKTSGVSTRQQLVFLGGAAAENQRTWARHHMRAERVRAAQRSVAQQLQLSPVLALIAQVLAQQRPCLRDKRGTRRLAPTPAIHRMGAPQCKRAGRRRLRLPALGSTCAAPRLLTRSACPEGAVV